MVMERQPSHSDPVSITIEPMRRRHLRGVLRIEQAVNPRPWSLSLFSSELRYRDSRVYLIARAGTELVGFAGLMLVAGDGHITNVGVVESHRRSAVATRLVLELARRALAEGAQALTLEVRVSNDAAQGLYRRFGFAPAGVRKAYYPPDDSPTNAAHLSGPGPAGREHEDALIMWANDIDTPEYRARLFEIEAALPTADPGSDDH